MREEQVIPLALTQAKMRWLVAFTEAQDGFVRAIQIDHRERQQQYVHDKVSDQRDYHGGRKTVRGAKPGDVVHPIGIAAIINRLQICA